MKQEHFSFFLSTGSEVTEDKNTTCFYQKTTLILLTVGQSFDTEENA